MTMLVTLYKTHRIQVEARELASGGFGIGALGVWRRRVDDDSEVYTALWVPDAVTFENVEAAEVAGVQLAKLAIDGASAQSGPPSL